MKTSVSVRNIVLHVRMLPKNYNFATVVFSVSTYILEGHAVVQLVEALHYKPAGHGFDSQWRHWNFSLTQSFWLHYGLGSTRPLTEMSTRYISWG